MEVDGEPSGPPPSPRALAAIAFETRPHSSEKDAAGAWKAKPGAPDPF